LYAVTSTVDNSNSDEGADPNEVVTVTDKLSNTTAAEAANPGFLTKNQKSIYMT